MELWQEILCKNLQNETTKKDLTNDLNLNKIVESLCYQALKRIKDIIQNEELDDTECFWKIEKIVQVLEELGSNGGNRHDFG